MKLFTSVKLRPLLLFISLAGSFAALGQKDTGLTKNMWYDYEGTLKDVPVQMSLYLFDNDSMKGNYVYKNEETKINLSGRLVNGQVELVEWFDGKANGYLKSTKWQNRKNNTCEGTWTDTTRDKSFEFTLQATGSMKAKYEHRYAEFSSDSILETFMKKVKSSVIYEDKDWLAEHISYPIDIHTHSMVATEPRSLEIKNKRALLEKYDMIFNTSFKNKVKNDVACNLWGNYMGYMLGSGDIWITPDAEGGKIKITAINN